MPNTQPADGLKSGKQTLSNRPQDILKRLGSSWGLLSLGFALTFIHLFWYGSVWTAWLALFCYAPFLVWLRLYSKRPFLAGWVFGLWYAILNNYWLGQFIGKWTQSVFIGGLAVFIVGTVWGIFHGASALVAKKFIGSMGAASAIAPIALWLPDLLRSYIPEFAYPFTPLGEPLVVYSSAIVFAPHCYFVSLIVCVFSVYCSRSQRESKPIIESIVVCGLIWLGSVIGPTPTIKPTPTKIALGQLGFDLAYTEDGLKLFKIREAANDLIRQARAQKADVLILPEAVAAFATTPNTAFDLPPASFVALPVRFSPERSPVAAAAAAAAGGGGGALQVELSGVLEVRATPIGGEGGEEWVRSIALCGAVALGPG